MRKLRRLPWRIPKSHNHQQPATAAPAVEISPRPEQARESHRDNESYRDMLNSQPVAFAAGRYVYGGVASAVTCPTEIRRKARHRVILGPTLNPQRA